MWYGDSGVALFRVVAPKSCQLCRLCGTLANSCSTVPRAPSSAVAVASYLNGAALGAIVYKEMNESCKCGGDDGGTLVEQVLPASTKPAVVVRHRRFPSKEATESVVRLSR